MNAKVTAPEGGLLRSLVLLMYVFMVITIALTIFVGKFIHIAIRQTQLGENSTVLYVREIHAIDGNTSLGDGGDGTNQDGEIQQVVIVEKDVAQSEEVKKTRVPAVLFTTMMESERKSAIYTNTLHNWSCFLPDVQPVLFITSPSTSRWQDAAESRGWRVLPCPRANKFGTPFLKDMYAEVMKLYDAEFYIWCNGDIMFSRGLVDTIASVIPELPKLKTTLIVGRRWNYNVVGSKHTDNAVPIWKPERVKQLANTNMAELFRIDAQDFFLVTKDFPWQQIKDVVVGRVAYDNYLLGSAIDLGVSTIDATDTVEAVHQTDEDGNYAGHNKSNSDFKFNYEVIGQYNYEKGYTTKTKYRTKFTQSPVVVIPRG